MGTFWIMLKNVLIFVLLAVPGYVLVKSKKLQSKSSGILSCVLTYAGMPGLILSSTLKLEFTAQNTVTMLLTALLGAALTAGMYFISAFLVNKKDPVKTKGMMRFAMIFANNGFIGIPLARAVFGENSPVMMYLIVLNILNNALMFTVGVYLISGDKKTISLKKAVVNPVLLAFFAGVLMKVLGMGSGFVEQNVLPELQTYATHFSNIVTPISMVVLGMKLAEVPLRKLFTSGKMYWAAAMRLVVYPVLCVGAILLLRLIPGLNISRDMIMGFFVAFAMPTAGLASVFSDQYDGDAEGAAIFTLGSTLLSVITISALYWALGMIV